jgi:hypothetical protein
VSGVTQANEVQRFRFPTAGDLVGGLVIGVVWVPLSFVLFLAYAAAEDNVNMSAVTPWPLKAAFALVSFPMRYIGSWDHPFHGLSDHAAAFWGFFGMFLNGIFWGLLAILLCRLLARQRRARRGATAR